MTSRIDIIGQNGNTGEHYDKVFGTQIAGDHYKYLAIQPMELSMANNLDPCQHTAIKYIMRHEQKGKKEDLEKAKHVIDMLIEFKYGENPIG